MFQRGFVLIDQEIARTEALKAQKLNEVPQFWVPVGETKEIVFIDSDPVVYQEHKIIKGDDWRNAIREVCIGENHCPLCAAGVPKSMVYAFTIIDLTKYTDKKGQEHTSTKRMMKLNVYQARAVLELSRQTNGLEGLLVAVTRNKKEDPASGANFTPLLKNGSIKKYNLADLREKGKDVIPFDFKKILQPKSPEKLKALVDPTSNIKPVSLENLEKDEDSEGYF